MVYDIVVGLITLLVVVVVIVPETLRSLHILLVLVIEVRHIPVILVKEIVFIFHGSTLHIPTVYSDLLILYLLVTHIGYSPMQQPNSIWYVAHCRPELFKISLIRGIHRVLRLRIIIVSALALFFFLVEDYHLVRAVLGDYVFQDAPPRFLLGPVHVTVATAHLVLEPFLILERLLLLAHLFFVDLGVVDEAHWTRRILSGWGVLVVATGHLLLHKFECVGGDRLGHYIVRYALYAVLDLVRGHALEHLLRVHYFGDHVVLTVNERGNRDLAVGSRVPGVLLLLVRLFNHSTEAIDLSLVILLRARLNFSMVHVIADSWITVAPIEPIYHKCHIPSSILLLLLLLQVIELQFGKPISILAFAIDPDRVRINLAGRCLTLRYELVLNLNHLASHQFAAVHLLLLGQCHHLAHWHLKLHLSWRN